MDNFFYIITFPALTKQSDMVWLMQKFCITSGVPLSIKLLPNLIFKTPQAASSLRKSFLIFPSLEPTIFNRNMINTLLEEMFTMAANVMTRML